MWTYIHISRTLYTYTLISSEIHTVSYLVLGFTQLILQFGEAEAGHGDEVTDHSHEFIPTFPRPALLVVQLLARGTDKNCVTSKPLCLSVRHTVTPCFVWSTKCLSIHVMESLTLSTFKHLTVLFISDPIKYIITDGRRTDGREHDKNSPTQEP